jgi:acetyl esterase/lipase
MEGLASMPDTSEANCRPAQPSTIDRLTVTVMFATGMPRQNCRRTTAMNFALRSLFVAFALALPTACAWAKDYEVVTRPNLEFAHHDGASLAGDLYLPKGLDKAPVMIAAHGGGCQAGNRSFYRYWGPFLARNGYAVFSIDYRLAKAGTYPGSVYDLKAAIQFVRAS